jgi:hypothetical protein
VLIVVFAIPALMTFVYFVRKTFFDELARNLRPRLSTPGITGIIGFVLWVIAMPFIPRRWLEDGSAGDTSIWTLVMIVVTTICFYWQMAWERKLRDRAQDDRELKRRESGYEPF